MIKEFIDNFDISVMVPIVGLCLFGYWMITTSIGRKALLDSKPRRNVMPPPLPWVFLLLWFIVAITAVVAVDFTDIPSGSEHWVLSQIIVLALVNASFGIVVLITAGKYFARGLKGLGINMKKIPRDAVWGFVNLFATWPVVVTALQATLLVGKMIYGEDYQIQKHEELELIRACSQTLIRTAILISGAVITPFFEEIFFRGLIQSAVRSYVVKPWPAIFISAGIFMMVHSPAHWLAVYVLGVLMGYAYEKSGSLLRPMFIHALFNGITIIAAISQSG